MSVEKIPLVDLAAQHREIAEEVARGFARVIERTAFILGEEVPEFERASGNKVEITYDPAKRMMARIRGGESADVAIIGSGAIDELAKDGLISAGTCVELACSSDGMAVVTSPGGPAGESMPCGVRPGSATNKNRPPGLM